MASIDLHAFLDDVHARYLDDMGSSFEQVIASVAEDGMTWEGLRAAFHDVDAEIARSAVRKYRQEIEDALVLFMTDPEVEVFILDDLVNRNSFPSSGQEASE